jgi:hypothetical protein
VHVVAINSRGNFVFIAALFNCAGSPHYVRVSALEPAPLLVPDIDVLYAEVSVVRGVSAVNADLLDGKVHGI